MWGTSQKPTQEAKKEDVLSRRLIDAQVAFGVGNFEEAALTLYDYVNQSNKGRDYDTALYYLAESLFQKGDRVSIWAPNIWEWVVTALGVHYAGGVLVPVNTRWKLASWTTVSRESVCSR